MFSLHTDVRVETLLEGTLEIMMYYTLILQIRTLRFKERKWLVPITELQTQLGLEFRFLDWQAFCFYYIILLLCRGRSIII